MAVVIWMDLRSQSHQDLSYASTNLQNTFAKDDNVIYYRRL